MSLLRINLIDVGWGDSILIESYTDSGDSHFALIDSNDTATFRSSYIFLKRFFERRGVRFPVNVNLFDWVLLSHIHADHGQGLKKVLQEFGTDWFCYPKSKNTALFFSDLLRYAKRYGPRKNMRYQHIDRLQTLPLLGDVSVDVLWPEADLLPDNENNNSVVLALYLGNDAVVLTGDAEAEVWDNIAADIPANTRFFKVPHHGSENGYFSHGQCPWLGHLDNQTVLGISSHIRPFRHPHESVIEDLDQQPRPYLRTDEHFHIIFETDGLQHSIKYCHA